MTTRADRRRDADATTTARAALRLSRGIAATWWFTFAAIVFYLVVLLIVWIPALLATEQTGMLTVAGIGGLLWLVATTALLLDYRNASLRPLSAQWRRALTPVIVAAAFGIVAGVATGNGLFAALPVVMVLVLVHPGEGIRLRVVLAATVLLGFLWFADVSFTLPPVGTSWWFIGIYSVFLPAVTVMSLWWWDVLVALDRARASEARLGATQERLRVATDVHDLQGHHLQVIALQLQLTERLLTTDAAAALEHLTAARASVDEARQGTRDLATRFRSVPLSSELANAVDLLHAAGTAAAASVDPDADSAPASVLAPVIRETTTNVLRHGGGRRASLSLSRTPTAWRFAISNDAEPEMETLTARDGSSGSGLDGIGRRVAEAGGTLEVHRAAKSFAVVVTVPPLEDVSAR